MSKFAQSQYDHIIKCVIIGDSCVGKTSLLLRYADDNWDDRYLATIGVDFRITTVEAMDKIVKVQLWDTAGQERFRGITHSYYRGAHAVLLCFDLTDLESFQNCAKWLNDIATYCPPEVSKFLVGTKVDLKDKRVVRYEDAKALAERLQCPYFETSSKESVGVEEAFKKVVDDVVVVKEKQKIKASNKAPVDLDRPRTPPPTCFSWLRSLF
jgi:Ras-related protein Rab-1A